MNKIIVFIGFAIFIGCSNNKHENETDEWAGTNWVQLRNENLLLRLPEEFKISSRFRIKEDLPIAQKFPNQLVIMQNYLEYLESLDSEIDVLIDTTKEYRMVIICNTKKMTIGKNGANLIRNQLETNLERNQKSNPLIKFSKMKGIWKENTTHQLAKYTTEITDVLESKTFYNSIYFLTGPSFTLNIYEISNEPDSIEKYLWTSKTL